MKKHILYTLSLSLLSLGGSAQVALRTADMLRMGERNSGILFPMELKKVARSVSENVEMIVRYDTEQTLKEIENVGGEIVNLVGYRTAIVSSPVAIIRNVAACKGVKGAMLSAPVKHTNNKALPASGVDAVRNGIDLPNGFDGEGVVVGLFDVGISPNHINFLDGDGKSRVSTVWNYKGTSSVPTIYDTPERIAAYTADTNSESHGTHVLGIMAGSFYDSSKEGAPDYRGVAPGAEIVVASGEGYSVQILDAIERIGAYAQSKGKPCVINLSFGDNVGPHDGTDEFTEAINDIAEKYNATICLSAGNEADQPIALVKTLTEADQTLSTLLIKNHNEEGGAFQVYGPVEVWTQDDTPFEVTMDIISPNAPDVPIYSFTVPVDKETYVVQGNTISEYLGSTANMELIKEGTEFHNLYLNSFMGGVAGIDNYNGRYCARLNFYIQGRSAQIIRNNFVKITVKGKAGQKVYMYTDGYYMEFGNKNLPGIDSGDGFGTNSNMASGKNTFSVGSYVSANVTGSGYPTGTIGGISYFSSFGETLDGRIMPDVAAPGQVIISSRNVSMPTTGSYAVYYPMKYNYNDPISDKTYYWTSCAGTSQSSPHVAGVMALMRQANPDLSYREIYDLVRSTATSVDDGRGVWGYGKLNAYESVKATLTPSGLESLSERGVEILSVETKGNFINIASLLDEVLHVSFYNAAGVCIFSNTVTDGHTRLDTSSFLPGIYILRVKGDEKEKIIKIRL